MTREAANAIETSVPALPACGESTAPLSAVPFRFHEDSSIQTRIDLNALDVGQYASLGVQVAREDGSELLFIKSRLAEGVPIGAAGRRFGLTVFGDPFLRLDE